MLGEKTRVQTRKNKVHRSKSISWLFFNEESAEQRLYRTVDLSREQSLWAEFEDINVYYRDDLVRIRTTAEDVLVCTIDQRIMTREGWKTVEELILDLNKHNILGRIQLCTVKLFKVIHPCIVSVDEIGHGEAYELKVNSPHPIVANNFLIGV